MNAFHFSQVPVRRPAAGKAAAAREAAAAGAAKGGSGKAAAGAAIAPATKALPKRKPAAKAVQEAESASTGSPIVLPQVCAFLYQSIHGVIMWFCGLLHREQGRHQVVRVPPQSIAYANKPA